MRSSAFGFERVEHLGRQDIAQRMYKVNQGRNQNEIMVRPGPENLAKRRREKNMHDFQRVCMCEHRWKANDENTKRVKILKKHYAMRYMPNKQKSCLTSPAQQLPTSVDFHPSRHAQRRGRTDWRMQLGDGHMLVVEGPIGDLGHVR